MDFNVTQEESDELDRLFNEFKKIGRQVDLQKGIVQNSGHYYSEMLPEFNQRMDYLAHKLKVLKEDVNEFHRTYDPDYKEEPHAR